MLDSFVVNGAAAPAVIVACEWTELRPSSSSSIQTSAEELLAKVFAQSALSSAAPTPAAADMVNRIRTSSQRVATKGSGVVLSALKPSAAYCTSMGNAGSVKLAKLAVERPKAIEDALEANTRQLTAEEHRLFDRAVRRSAKVLYSL